MNCFGSFSKCVDCCSGWLNSEPQVSAGCALATKGTCSLDLIARLRAGVVPLKYEGNEVAVQYPHDDN